MDYVPASTQGDKSFGEEQNRSLVAHISKDDCVAERVHAQDAVLSLQPSWPAQVIGGARFYIHIHTLPLSFHADGL